MPEPIFDIGDAPDIAPPTRSERDQMLRAMGFLQGIVVDPKFTLVVNGDNSMGGFVGAEIGESQFSGATLIAARLGSTVTNIGSSAFYGCSYLAELYLSDVLTNIGYNAFNSCSSLTSLSLPASMTNIGDSAFVYCEGLTRIEIHAPVAPTIGSDAFYGCTGVSPAEIHVPIGATGYAPAYDGLTVVYDL